MMTLIQNELAWLKFAYKHDNNIIMLTVTMTPINILLNYNTAATSAATNQLHVV